MIPSLISLLRNLARQYLMKCFSKRNRHLTSWLLYTVHVQLFGVIVWLVHIIHCQCFFDHLAFSSAARVPMFLLIGQPALSCTTLFLGLYQQRPYDSLLLYQLN